jgi:hypothetical protein
VVDRDHLAVALGQILDLNRWTHGLRSIGSLRAGWARPRSDSPRAVR